jgi:hypothetical protein
VFDSTPIAGVCVRRRQSRRPRAIRFLDRTLIAATGLCAAERHAVVPATVERLAIACSCQLQAASNDTGWRPYEPALGSNTEAERQNRRGGARCCAKRRGTPPSSSCLSALRWCACTPVIRGTAARHGARPPILATVSVRNRMPAIRCRASGPDRPMTPAIEPVAVRTPHVMQGLEGTARLSPPGVVAPWRGMFKLTALDRIVGVVATPSGCIYRRWTRRALAHRRGI